MNKKHSIAFAMIIITFPLCCMDEPDPQNKQLDWHKQFDLRRSYLPSLTYKAPARTLFYDLIDNDAMLLRTLVAQEQAGDVCNDLLMAEKELHSAMKNVESAMLNQCKKETAQFVRNIADKSELYQLLIAATDSMHLDLFRTIIESNRFVVNAYGAPPSYNNILIPPLHYILRKAGTSKEFNEISCDYMRILLCAGANPNARDDKKDTPMHYIVTPEHCNLLLEFGAKMDICGERYRTPLFNHIRLQNCAIAQLLILGGARISMRDDNGDTPLHEAITKNLPIIVDLLLRTNADYKSRNYDGKTALDKAIKKPAIKTIFENYLQLKLCHALRENNEKLVTSIVTDCLPWMNFVRDEIYILDWAKMFSQKSTKSIYALERLLSNKSAYCTPPKNPSILKDSKEVSDLD